MTRDFFEEQIVILIEAEDLRKAEQLIVGCEACSEDAEIPRCDWWKSLDQQAVYVDKTISVTDDTTTRSRSPEAPVTDLSAFLKPTGHLLLPLSAAHSKYLDDAHGPRNHSSSPEPSGRALVQHRSPEIVGHGNKVAPENGPACARNPREA